MADSQRRIRAADEPVATVKTYKRHEGGRVWARPGYGGIAYSDGQAAERELLGFLKRATDLSSTSDELGLGVDDWIREAHLSPARSNLLRPLDFSGCRRVL